MARAAPLSRLPFLLVAALSASLLLGALWLRPPPAAPSGGVLRSRAVMGELVQADADSISVRDGIASFTFQLSESTGFARQIGGVRVATTAAGLRAGDAVMVSGHERADGRLVAGWVEANPRLREQERAVSDHWVPRFGRLAALDGNVYTLEGGETFLVDSETEVRRGQGHELVVDRRPARLQIGDNLDAACHILAGGSYLAKVVMANEFVNRAGLITAVGEGYLDVRLNRGRLVASYDAEATRVYPDPSARIEALGPGGGRTLLTAADLYPGLLTDIYGFVADDGAVVALTLLPFAPSPQ